MDKWVDKFRKDFGEDTAYRFYENLIAATMTAGEIAVKANIVNFDLIKIYNKIVGEMVAIRDNVVKVNSVDYESLIGEFINLHQTGILAFNADNKTCMEPRTALVIRAEDDTGTIFIPRSIFNNYLISELDINKSDFKKRITNSDIKFWEEKKRMLTGWKDASSSEYNLMCYAFQKKEILDKLKGDISGSA